MFGLESWRNSQFSQKEFVYDLEKDLKCPEKRKAILDRVETNLKTLKYAVSLGVASEEFIKLSVLIEGYISLKLVIERWLYNS